MSNHQSHKTIMIIEDDEDIQSCLRDALHSEGYEIITANNGQAALEILAKTQKPSVIFLDLMMPKMDGWEFRSRQIVDPKIADIPTVILSADGNLKKRAEKLRADAYLTKPVDLESLFRVALQFSSHSMPS